MGTVSTIVVALLVVAAVIWGVALLFLPIFVWAASDHLRAIRQSVREIAADLAAQRAGPRLPTAPGGERPPWPCPVCGGELITLTGRGDTARYCPTCREEVQT